MGLWPYYSNALLYGDYANEANLHTRTKVHGIVTPKIPVPMDAGCCNESPQILLVRRHIWVKTFGTLDTTIQNRYLFRVVIFLVSQPEKLVGIDERGLLRQYSTKLFLYLSLYPCSP